MDDSNKVETFAYATLSNVFISFAKTDEEFVHSLDAAFTQQGRRIWIDWKDATRSEERDQEIMARIEAADNFMFIISTDSINSEDCRKELAHAVYHQKRLIPVVYKVAGADLPQALSGISAVSFQQPNRFSAAFQSLINRIDADLKLDIFISYSRKDEAFVQTLEQAFRTAERKCWIDRKKIQHTEEWLKAIFSGIEASDNFLFVITPDSVNSLNCAKELAHAVEHNKRLIPIIHRDVDDQRVPPALAELDWVPFVQTAEFTTGFETLLRAVDTDLDYVQAHTRLLTRAIEWDNRGRDASLVLRGTDLRQAEQWLVSAGSKKPRATPLQSQYITASRQNATRRQRILLSAITAGLLITIGLFIGAVYQYRIAERERLSAKQRLSTLYEEQGRQQLLAGSSVKALAFLNQAYQEGGEAASLKFLIAQAYRVLVGQTTSFNHHTQPVRAVAMSSDGRLIASGSDDSARVWDPTTGKEKSVLFASEPGGVRSLAFNANDHKVVIGNADASVKIWNADDGALLKSMNGHQSAVDSVEFSHNGKYVVSAGLDGVAFVWDVSSGNKLFELSGHSVPPLFKAIFSPDDKLILTASADKTAKLWDASNGKLLFSLEGHTNWVDAIAFSPDGRKIATAGYDNSAKIWNVQNGKLLVQLHKRDGTPQETSHDGPINSILFSNDGKHVLTSSWDKTAKIWDADSGELLTTLSGHRNQLNVAAFNASGTRVVTASEDHTVKVWDVQNGAMLASLDGHTEPVNSAFFMTDDRYVVTASNDTRVIVWDWAAAAAASVPITLKAHTNTVSSASFSHEGMRVVTASADGSAKVWDASNGTLLASCDDGKKHWIRLAIFSPDDQRIATVSDAGAEIWDASSGRHLLSLFPNETDVNSAAFASDNRLVTANADTTAIVWDATTGKQLVSLRGHKDAVNTAVFNRDGTRIVTASNDGTAKIWDAATGNLLASLEGHSSVVFTAFFDARFETVVTASADKTAKLWDAVTGKLLGSLEGHTEAVTMASFGTGSLIVTASQDNSAKLWLGGSVLASLDAHTDDVKVAAFDNTGGRIVTAGDDRTVKIWDTLGGRLLISLEGHTGWIESAVFSPDGTRLITASVDHTAKIWNVEPYTHSKEELNEVIKRRVPLQVAGSRLVPIGLLSTIVPGRAPSG